MCGKRNSSNNGTGIFLMLIPTSLWKIMTTFYCIWWLRLWLLYTTLIGTWIKRLIYIFFNFSTGRRQSFHFMLFQSLVPFILLAARSRWFIHLLPLFAFSIFWGERHSDYSELILDSGLWMSRSVDYRICICYSRTS